MINRGDIKLAIDMVVNAQDDELFGGEAEYVINTLEDCGNEITKLREQVAAQAAEIARLKTVPMKYRRMQFNAELQEEVARLREQVAAQAAVIEKLLEALTKIATARIGKPERWAHALFSDEKIAVEALAIPSDSTQILAEVRRAERVAQYVQQGTGDWMLGKNINTME